MFDIHAHILPGIDDGPKSLEESLAAIAALVSEGVSGIVATPHFNDQFPHVPAFEVRQRVTELRRVVEKQGIEVQLWAGHEVLLDTTVEAALAAGQAGSINQGPYVLVELPIYEFPITLPMVLGQLRKRGYVPVIAHAERYKPTQRDPDVLVPLVEAGMLLQITVSSLTGKFGRTVQQTAETLMRRDMAHVLASDAHSLSLRRAYLTTGLRAAEALVGASRVRQMVETVPLAIIHGEKVDIPPIRHPSRTWISTMLRRAR